MTQSLEETLAELAGVSGVQSAEESAAHLLAQVRAFIAAGGLTPGGGLSAPWSQVGNSLELKLPGEPFPRIRISFDRLSGGDGQEDPDTNNSLYFNSVNFAMEVIASAIAGGPSNFYNDLNVSSIGLADARTPPQVLRSVIHTGLLGDDYGNPDFLVSIKGPDGSGSVEAFGLKDGASGETSMLVTRNLSGVFTMQRVSMGAVDSGGAGFRALRVPN